MDKVFYSAEDAWNLFEDSTEIDELPATFSKVIACDEDSGIEVQFGCDEPNGIPAITVLEDDEVVEYIPCHTRKDFYDSFADICNSLFRGESKGKDEEHLDEIEVREDEMDDIMSEMLSNLCPGYEELVDSPIDLLEDMKDFICEKLFAEYGISVHRPMILEDDEGNLSYSEYPYPELDPEGE